jgi:hypothetical protein
VKRADVPKVGPGQIFQQGVSQASPQRAQAEQGQSRAQHATTGRVNDVRGMGPKAQTIPNIA